MAASTLRRYSSVLPITSTTLVTVPTARALVVSKILISSAGTATVTVLVGGANILTLPMTSGQVYTETALVVLAGETITATASLAATITLSVYGEEVDN
jgi:hypothetical protein